tara:strand:+ start:327 stop:608 length:282 start_codon:yes stop_codon:yes gene_type:complete
MAEGWEVVELSTPKKILNRNVSDTEQWSNKTKENAFIECHYKVGYFVEGIEYAAVFFETKEDAEAGIIKLQEEQNETGIWGTHNSGWGRSTNN